jgi:HPt (histidine-containing phosphotransfer) domain-containing protein
LSPEENEQAAERNELASEEDSGAKLRSADLVNTAQQISTIMPKHDLSYLRESTNNDLEIMQRILNTFKEESSQDIMRMKIAASEGDSRVVSDIAHKLRPSAHYVGSKELEDLLQVVENEATNSSRTDLLEYADRLDKLLLEVSESIAASPLR